MRPSAFPRTAASASAGGFRHRTSGVGTGAHRHRLELDVGAPLISVDLQEHVADAQRHAIVVGKDDLDLIHIRHLHLTVDQFVAMHTRTTHGSPEAG